MLSAETRALLRRLREHALTLPEAWEDHPWGENVTKVRKKVFVFHGADEGDYRPNLTVKLTDSHDAALAFPEAAPTGYGLGRSGWVTLPVDAADLPPAEVLCDWIEESYRLVAPKTLAARLDAP